MTETAAPIGVFAYNREASLMRTLRTLERCHGFRGERVHIFCDDARGAADRAGVDETRRAASEWCRQQGARVVLRDGNHGFRNLSDGVGELCAQYGRTVSMDDDHEASPHMLTFLDRALDVYRDDTRVFQAAGYFPGAVLPNPAPDAFFVPFPMSMAWGTWHRAWSRFRWDISADGRRVLDDPSARLRFDLGGRYPATRLLALALKGEFDSYFIRWYLAMFLAGGLALCTTRSLVRNFGFTGGIHPGPDTQEREDFFNGGWAAGDVDPASWVLPTKVEADEDMITRVCQAVRNAGITRNLAKLDTLVTAGKSDEP